MLNTLREERDRAKGDISKGMQVFLYIAGFVFIGLALLLVYISIRDFPMMVATVGLEEAKRSFFYYTPFAVLPLALGCLLIWLFDPQDRT